MSAKTLGERLKAWADVYRTYVDPPFWQTWAKEAADALARQQRVIQVWRKEADWLRGLINERQSDIPPWLALEWVDEMIKRAAEDPTALTDSAGEKP